MKITMGIRIYPYTDLARTAIKERFIAPDDDLLFPKFYMAPGLDEWLRSTVSAGWMDDLTGCSSMGRPLDSSKLPKYEF